MALRTQVRWEAMIFRANGKDNSVTKTGSLVLGLNLAGGVSLGEASDLGFRV